MSLPVPRIEDPWQQRKPVFIAFGIIGILLGILWIWGVIATGQSHPAHILRVIHDGPGPQPPPGAPSKTTPAEPPEIKFYGKVVDESGAPIPDAEVRLTLQDSSGGARQTLDRATSADGNFSIHGHRTDYLKVEVSKLRYSNVPFPSEGGAISSAEFSYGVKPSLIKLHDTFATPLVLTLWQPQRAIGTATEDDFRTKLVPDGSPYQIKLRDPAGTALHTIELRYWNTHTRTARTARNPYSWNATIFVHGGTIMEKAPAQILPEAPATGYIPSISIDFPDTLPVADWKNETTRHYYIRFADNTHGILTLTLNSGTHKLEGRIIHNRKPNDPDLTGPYLLR